MIRRAVVLFSGGLDSTTLLYYVRSKGYKPHCLVFDYGQRHKKEIEQAKKIAVKIKVPYTVVKLALPWKGSSLVDKNLKLPAHAIGKIGRSKALPSTYVPGRNTVFLAFALSCAEALKAWQVFIGANAIDFSGYPDCRQGYFDSWNRLVKSLRLKGPVEIKAPFVKMTKAQIIKLGMKLKVPYDMTWSCYAGLKKPCGVCDSCRLRQEGFKKAL